MRQKTGFEAWFDASRADVARVFTNLGDGLEDGKLNWEAISIDVPESVEVEIECGADEGDDEYEFEFSMSWDASAVAEEPATNGAAESADPAEEATDAVQDGGGARRGAPEQESTVDPVTGTESDATDEPQPGDENHPADRSF